MHDDEHDEQPTAPEPDQHQHTAIEGAALVAWLGARGLERDQHPLPLAAFQHPTLARAAQRLTRLHHRGWAPARPFVEVVPLHELEAPAHRGQLAALLPRVAPPVHRAVAQLLEHARPRLEREQRAINRSRTRDDCDDGGSE